MMPVRSILVPTNRKVGASHFASQTKRCVTIWLALASWLTLESCGPAEREVSPSRKPLVEAVYASGFLKTVDEYAVLAEGEGHVQEKLVSDGALVKKGDPIYILSAQQPDARYQIARQNYELARRNNQESSSVLQELNFTLQSLQSKKSFDSINFIRYQNLWNSQATTRVNYDKAKLAYENTTHEYKAAKNRFDKVKSDLQLAFDNARQQLLIAADDAGRQVITSKMEGRLLAAKKEVGELVRRGEQIALIGKSDAYYLQLNVDEQDISKLQLGQKVIFTTDALHDSVFVGRVSKIYSLVDTRQQSLRVDVAIPTSFPISFSGLAAEANIIIRENEQALVLPKSALLPGDSIWVNKEGVRTKIKIERGIETLDEVEVTSGVDSATRVLIVE